MTRYADMTTDEIHARQDENMYRRLGRQEDRAIDKMDRQLNECDKLVGKLNREGKTVYYINVLSAKGVPTGRTKEFTTRSEANSYLIRNRYV